MRSRRRIKGQPTRFIRGHNSYGVDRSGPRKTHYVEEDRGYDTPCWIWQLRVTKPNARSAGGYGKLGVKGRDYLAHRWYYEQSKGKIPDGMQLHHLCEVPACVNPDHLEPVTALQNMRLSRSMKLSQHQAEALYRDFRAGIPRAELQKKYGVSRATISFIGRNGPEGPRNPRR